MSIKKHLSESHRFALPAAELAKLLGVSERHVWALNASGRLPRPVRLGRAVRWPVEELRNWLAAGAPERSRWEAIKETRQ
ncbi:MAG: helix-turn-helix transcriptional regulator [Planctomycetota bacterium]|jgi:excisionase family DNA binding protein